MTKAAFLIPGDISLPTGGYTYDRRVLALLPHYGIHVTHVSLPGSYPAPPPADLEATAAVLARQPTDAVLLIDGLALGAMPASLIQTIRQPVVALCHHPLALEAGLTPERQAVLRRSETEALARAAHVIVTSPMTRQIVTSDFAVATTRCTVAEPGTDPAGRAFGSDPGAASVSILAVGSIVPRKGYDILVRALEQLADRRWLVTIAGSDDRSPETTRALREAIRDAAFSDRVRLLGAVGQQDLDRLYHAADIFVMPSLFEGYGMVIAEAMARGLPIVCTTGGAAADTAPDAAALKVAPGDANAFAAALAEVIDDHALRARMADASWRAGEALPRWTDTARIIAGVLRRFAP